jgi:alginate O-acetyltransferase complex protein AlgJ
MTRNNTVSDERTQTSHNASGPAPAAPAVSKPRPLTREEQAKLEIGHTTISRPVAWMLVIALFAVIFAEPVVQTIYDYSLYRQQQQQAAADPSFKPDRDTAWPRYADLLRDGPQVSAGMAAAYDAAPGTWFDRVVAANVVLMRHMKKWEDSLGENSYLAGQVRPPTQTLLTRCGVGNEEAYIGRDGWLFYRQEIDHLTGRGFLEAAVLLKRQRSGGEAAAIQPDPRLAIADFARQLKQRGVELVIVPVPCKPQVHPEKFTSRFDGGAEPLYNASFEQFAREMRAAGVHVVDLAPAMVRARAAGEQYLWTDTHWRPEAMEAAAAQLAAYLRDSKLLAAAQPAGYTRGQRTVKNLGDIAEMLKLPPEQTLFAPQEVTIRPVATADGQPLAPSAESQVLLLGDSYTNIYGLDIFASQRNAARGWTWGQSAGLAEQLAFELQQPVDRLSRNDSGAWASRDMLREAMLRGDRLAGKKVVVWEFAVRELTRGDWKMITLKTPSRTASSAPAATAPAAGGVVLDDGNFLAQAAGGKVQVTGVVAAVSPRPDPTATYGVFVMMLHLKDVRTADGKLSGAQAVVRILGMVDHKLTPAAAIQPGQTVTLNLRPWTQVQARYESEKGDVVPDDDLAMRPWWFAE